MKQILVLIAMTGSLSAHEVGEHMHKAGQEVKAAVVAGAAKAEAAVKDSVTKAGNATDAAVQEVVVQAKPFEILKAHATKYLHNKIVHFPIALGFFGAIFLLLSFRYPSYKWPARVLLFFAGVAAAFALPTGQAQEGAFDGTSLKEVLGWHERSGQVSTALIWGAFLLSFFEVTRKFFWLYALALFWFLFMAGALGGILATS